MTKRNKNIIFLWLGIILYNDNTKVLIGILCNTIINLDVVIIR